MYMNVESISGNIVGRTLIQSNNVHECRKYIGQCSRTLIQSNMYMNVESISGNVVGH